MSVAGICELCEADSVEDSCDRCGRLVCAHHYDEPTGLCTVCVAELDGGSGNDDRDGGGYPDGVDEYRF